VCDKYNHELLNYLITFHTDLEVPPSKETLDAITQPNAPCGPEITIANKPKPVPKPVFSTWNKRIKLAVENKARSPENRLAQPPHIDDIQQLRDFFTVCARRVQSDTPGPGYDHRWFSPTTTIFKHLVQEQGGNSETPEAEQWNLLYQGINQMTLEQLRRLYFYGTMSKVPQCLFLCTWFHKMDRIQLDPGCGSSSKLKPK
jgi:hypothetical protein